MNCSKTIPLPPKYNLTSTSVSTPQNGLLYITSETVTYISHIENFKSIPEIKIFRFLQNVKSIDCDPDWSKTKYFAALVEDNSIQVWDTESSKAVLGHKVHIRAFHDEGSGYDMRTSVENVKFCFLKNRNILSIDSSFLVLYCISSNTYVRSNRIIPKKHEISIVKGSPFDESVFAAGTSNGLVMLVNFKKEEILYNLRGHDMEVTSFSWTLGSPVEDNPSITQRPILKAKKTPIPASDDCFDIYDYDYLENEFGAPSKMITNTGINDDSFVGIEKPKNEANDEHFNFSEACKNLKEDIQTMKTDDKDRKEDEVTLQDCQNSETVNQNTSLSCGSSHSLELISSVDSATEEHVLVHNAEVHVPNKDNKEQNVILASASKEGKICIWNTKNGRAMVNHRLKTSFTKMENFIDLAWTKVNTLIANSKSGELLMFTLTAKGSDEFALRDERKKFHSKQGIVAVCPLKNTPEVIWTLSYNRELICENTKSGKLVAKFSCASTNVICLKERTDDMNKIAFPCNDRRVSILNISTMSNTNITIDNHTNKGFYSIRSLAWSPVDQLLAFGTSEGRVGIIDTEKVHPISGKSKESYQGPFIMNPFFGKPIYSMAWCGDYIYICCNESVIYYCGRRKSRDGKKLSIIKDASSVTARNSILLVGTQSGNIEYYKIRSKDPEDIELVNKIFLSNKYISDINWSSIQLNRFAVCSFSNKIAVLRITADENMEMERFLSIPEEANCKNVCVKFSNRNENMLLSCGSDGGVRIWDLKQSPSKELIYVKWFSSPMNSALFSPIDENVIICCGKSTSVELFDMSKEPSEKLTENKVSKTKNLKDIQWAVKALTAEVTGNAKNRRNRKKTNGIPKENEIVEKLNELSLDTQKPNKTSGGFMKSDTTVLYLSFKETNRQTLQSLNTFLAKDSESTLMSAKLFGSKKDVEMVLHDELQNHKNSMTNSIGNIFIPLAAGELEKEILKATKSKTLTEWHVSISPMISFDFWKKCCGAFASQLIDHGYILQAATYLSCLHQTKEVIDILLKNTLFLEAWSFAKLHLEEEDSIFNDIADKWTRALEINGNLEGAAFICALNGDFEKCRDILRKRRRDDEGDTLLQLVEEKIK